MSDANFPRRNNDQRCSFAGRNWEWSDDALAADEFQRHSVQVGEMLSTLKAFPPRTHHLYRRVHVKATSWTTISAATRLSVPLAHVGVLHSVRCLLLLSTSRTSALLLTLYRRIYVRNKLFGIDSVCNADLSQVSITNHRGFRDLRR